MADFEDEIEKIGKESRELRKLQSQVSDEKHQYTNSVIGSLLESLEQAIGTLVIQNSKNQYYDKELSGKLQTTVSDLIKAFSEIKQPNIEFKPQVKVDMQPIANEISRQNDTMIKLLNKLSDGSKTDELQRLILVMTQKQIAFLEKGMQQHDYSNELKLISDAITNNDDKVKELTVYYHDNGRIQKVIPIYKNVK